MKVPALIPLLALTLFLYCTDDNSSQKDITGSDNNIHTGLIDKWLFCDVVTVDSVHYISFNSQGYSHVDSVGAAPRVSYYGDSILTCRDTATAWDVVNDTQIVISKGHLDDLGNFTRFSDTIIYPPQTLHFIHDADSIYLFGYFPNHASDSIDCRAKYDIDRSEMLVDVTKYYWLARVPIPPTGPPNTLDTISITADVFYLFMRFSSISDYLKLCP